ncbi:22684_t:CDS:2 [Gigaspora rosea]|nr:22684_t:CDS:2 [Gigaspora rosea]
MTLDNHGMFQFSHGPFKTEQLFKGIPSPLYYRSYYVRTNVVRVNVCTNIRTNVHTDITNV